MSETDWSAWGHLRHRYEKPGPRKMLALDGGGMRGIITLEVLQRLEDSLRTETNSGPEFRLCDFFDYISGTSTGAIIATGLARGMSVSELKNLYVTMAEAIFTPEKISARLKHRYSSANLEHHLREIFKHSSGEDATLEPKYLRCLLMVVLKNVTTDSPWPLSSNPAARYNDQARSDCNLHLPLWQVVRSSAAAPTYFPPERIVCGPQGASFVFADGALTPYNNPAFQLYKMATLPEYRLRWKTGEKDLLLVSIGTGKTPNTIPFQRSSIEGPIWETVSNTILSLLNTIQDEQDINCRSVGRCIFGPHIDSELGHMCDRHRAEEPRKFTYIRYDADLSLDTLMKIGLSTKRAQAVRAIDQISAIPDLQAIGISVAEQFDIAHIAPFFQSLVNMQQ